MEQRLIDFIVHARQKGMDHATIRVLLLSAGWKEKEVARALAAEGLELAVPEPPGAGTARDAFLHLLLFTSLYIMVVSLIVLYFEYFNRLLPDAAQDDPSYLDGSLSTVRWSLAMLIVTAPLFFGLAWLVARELRRDPARVQGGFRRWLIYTTLFVAGMTATFDLVTLLYYFLEGELTARFVLKVLILLLLTGTVFLYYLLSLRAQHEKKS